MDGAAIIRKAMETRLPGGGSLPPNSELRELLFDIGLAEATLAKESPARARETRQRQPVPVSQGICLIPVEVSGALVVAFMVFLVQSVRPATGSCVYVSPGLDPTLSSPSLAMPHDAPPLNAIYRHL